MAQSGHANFAVYIVEGLLVFFILFKIYVARRGRELYIRRIAGLSSLEEAVGRATEMGRPMLFVPGIGGLDVVGLQAMAILSNVVRKAAKFSTRVIVPNIDPLLYTISEEVSKEAFAAEGNPEQFNEDDIRFLSSDQFAYTAGVVGIMHREKTATVLYFGWFFAESLILAENGQLAGAIQIAGTPSTTQIPFFLAACDYTIIGDEYYAASAYLSREPTLLGSLVGQDYGKLLIIWLIIVGALAVTVSALQNTSPMHIPTWFETNFLNYFLKKG
ncbi:MAG: hypothetical protein NT018_10355 [Armatimonadetes bacterium]|nr:hypothetical protein [Armatimonadota bacterium]